MKNKMLAQILALVMVVCMLFTSCAAPLGQAGPATGDDGKADTGVQGDALSSTQGAATPKLGSYNEGVVLVKYEGEMNDAVLSQLALQAAEPLYEGSTWYSLTLREGADTAETVNYLRELGCFEKVDFDYVMGVTADVASVDVSGNPHAGDQPNLGLHNIPKGWTQNGKHPGGSPDVIVAVIDTGVDYTHLDLRNNIWVNPAEIAGNGKDDDGNGYIDDIYGWDCVGNDKDPMDDNGHGTHVAGIIAAENNKIGGVGVAYGCKIMVLKAGNSSGYFNNSDIAEAVQYAYMNGASVINMSFGGSNISIAVEEALENAYNSCVLVAAAGNEGACNNLACKTCDVKAVSYPAALPFVIGVMSTNAGGGRVSAFSNYDHNPYDSIEYEVYAVGEGVGSTWPGNKYANLNGTSMAAPTVSGIAALLRSMYPDRETYSTKYLQSQIVNTGTVNPYNEITEKTDAAHAVADVYEALTRIPKPAVNLYDYAIDDSTAISEKNNGNGVIDAGETVRLSISLQNRGGVATNVNVSIDTLRAGGNTDPYFTFVNTTLALSDIGTYSVRESGEQYFEIIVSDECPNDYLVDFNIRFTYENGLDEDDKTVYEDDGKQKAQFNVSRGFHLPSTITEDTVYTADRLYIVGEDVVIPEGVTVTFEEGCEIQFYDDREYYNSPKFRIFGTLNFSGTKDQMVRVFPNERHSVFQCGITVSECGVVKMNYVDIINLYLYDNDYSAVNKATSIIENSCLRADGISEKNGAINRICYYSAGYVKDSAGYGGTIDTINNCFLDLSAWNSYLYIRNLNNSIIPLLSKNGYRLDCSKSFENNVLLVMPGGTGSGKETFFRNVVKNNYFFSTKQGTSALITLTFENTDVVSNNAFSISYQKHASQAIENYYDSTGNPTIDVYGSLADASLLWPHVVSVEMFDADGNPITTIGREEITVRVTFNRPMDKNAGTFLTFGTIEPYGDYRIDGAYVSDTVWEGTYTLKAQIENGQNFLKVNNAWAAEDQTKTVFGEYQLHEFTIDTTAAMAMNLQAVAKDNGIELTFAQDDYDTLLGYNIYRATEKDGNYVKLNPAILLPSDSTFLDENAEPGKTYWYTYTVVLTDFTESNPAGKVMATAKDTMAPSLYHTPVNQGYLNNNLVISCTASDNVAITSVVLYYRAVGTAAWKTLNMSKQSDKYSATIFGGDLTSDGIEYYIVANDTLNSIAKGSAETPYTVVIKDSSAISRKGDVDGDGTVTTKDALMLMQTINEERILTDDEFKRADLNSDGILNSAEALRILQYINGNVTTLEM